MTRRKKKRRVPTTCPCGSGSSYKSCCKPFTSGAELPSSPEKLMRSRFSAYALAKTDYIIDTTLPDSEAWEGDLDVWRDRIRVFSKSCDFHGVDILDAPAPVGDHGEVEFKARISENGRDVSFVERSQFSRRDDRWYYTSGTRVGEA